ncbi:Phosphatidylinositol N-acetylglucosaminyltransferase GPI2 subunit [Pseudocercospora fuligena]|uniref:Phosphatidylinositol N-acetylglucosaminyltransferase GPI2 subunit n=1 Tax=Pseudocercospora fuligena TaxID=685502 RepID=A0A8H6R5E3_9PEZI|nr:Phosphatidylinositol N-acetylglucosaminyltransferase GPI2 subunit [Pseudocercospora fuligena]
MASIQSSRASSILSTTRRSSEQHLRPEDAFYHSPPRKGSIGRSDTVTARNSTSRTRSSREKRRGRSSSRRRAQQTPKGLNGNGQWKKLLWIKSPYPDNYTDEETFLSHLQRNPRLRPYEFWPLVADSTIIVQHVCSVVIFVACFVGIFQDRIKPESVVGWASGCTVAGWVFRDWWQSQGNDGDATDEDGSTEGLPMDEAAADDNTSSGGSATADLSADFGMPFKEPTTTLSPTSTTAQSRAHSREPSTASTVASPTVSSQNDSPTTIPPNLPSFLPPYNPSSTKSIYLSPRMQERLTTAKSAVLIYCSLLGLSPILKSLTLSTSSDSIWALSSWLLILNIFTFDYGAGPSAKFPASLSTNAALMASTVLASRLPSTTHVFSLTLFSIEVFGLFPVFRRHLRHYSWTGHVYLTILLVLVASGGLSMCISGGGWGYAVLGVVLGGIVTCLSMGMTSWWLIGLQRYKNEIHGPWDPARPVIRRQWQ